MDEDFVNLYVQRLLKEIDYLNRDRLLKETRISILESSQELNKSEVAGWKTSTEANAALRDQALSSLELLTVEHKDLQALHETTKESYENKIKELNNRINELHADINKLNSNLSNEKSRADNLDREVVRQSDELNKMFKELSDLRKKTVDTVQPPKKPASRKNVDGNTF